VSRNVPPIAGAVAWVRQLLRRVEGPMEVFRNDSAVMQSVVSDFAPGILWYQQYGIMLLTLWYQQYGIMLLTLKLL